MEKYLVKGPHFCGLLFIFDSLCCHYIMQIHGDLHDLVFSMNFRSIMIRLASYTIYNFIVFCSWAGEVQGTSQFLLQRCSRNNVRYAYSLNYSWQLDENKMCMKTSLHITFLFQLWTLLFFFYTNNLEIIHDRELTEVDNLGEIYLILGTLIVPKHIFRNGYNFSYSQIKQFSGFCNLLSSKAVGRNNLVSVQQKHPMVFFSSFFTRLTICSIFS